MEKIKIILVDDEVLFRKGIAYLLQSEKNIEVVFEAENGEELINYLRLTHDFPDVILMDLHMPKLDGYQVSSVIKSDETNINYTTPIIAFTASVSDSILADIRAVGMKDFIYKPFNIDEMYTKLRNIKGILNPKA